MKIIIPSDRDIKKAFGIYKEELSDIKCYGDDCAESGDCTGGICSVSDNDFIIVEQKETIVINQTETIEIN